MSLADLLTEDRRLVILRSLDEAPAKVLNEAVLQAMLSALGHVVGRDVVRADLSWLETHALLRLEHLALGGERKLWRAELRAEGEDVARGRIHAGVKQRGAD